MQTIEWDVVWMSLVIFIPSVFALIVLLIPRGWEEVMRWVTLFGTALTLGISLCMFVNFHHDTIEFQQVLTDPTLENLQHASLNYRAHEADFRKTGDKIHNDDWVARYPWIPRFNVDYYVGADGISMALVLLTTVLFFLSMIASWKIDKFVKGYCALFLVLETGVLGSFLALDFFLFYIFREECLDVGGQAQEVEMQHIHGLPRRGTFCLYAPRSTLHAPRYFTLARASTRPVRLGPIQFNSSRPGNTPRATHRITSGRAHASSRRSMSRSFL